MKTIGAATGLNYSRYVGNTPLTSQLDAQNGVFYAASALAFAGSVVLNESFRPSAQATPNMTVALAPGTLQKGTALTKVAGQNSAAFVAPVGNPRWDVVYIDALTGVIGVAAGTPAGSPVDPAVPAGKIAVARVRLATTTTAIDYTLIDDLRFPSNAGGAYTNTAVGITLAASNNDGIVNVTGAGGITLAITAIANLPTGWTCTIANKSAANVTLDPDAAETIDGIASRVMEPGNRVTIYFDGTSLKTFSGFYTKTSTATAMSTANVSTPHGFPRKPTRIKGLAICISSDGTFAVGDEIDYAGCWDVNQAVLLLYNATNFVINGMTRASCGAKNAISNVELDETKWNVQGVVYDEY